VLKQTGVIEVYSLTISISQLKPDFTVRLKCPLLERKNAL